MQLLNRHRTETFGSPELVCVSADFEMACHVGDAIIAPAKPQ